jgi:hypothetical protein
LLTQPLGECDTTAVRQHRIAEQQLDLLPAMQKYRLRGRRARSMKHAISGPAKNLAGHITNKGLIFNDKNRGLSL